jgi:glutamate N-acetyltransferase / amino-acid N-acetyltransferase
MTALPRGFRAHVGSIGIKDDLPDFVVVAAERACPAAAVFTKSRFEGPSVTISRDHVADGQLRAFTVLSRNANVATGDQGRRDADEVVAGVASALGCPPGDVLIASTGVIGRPYPMERVRPHLARLADGFTEASAEPVAAAMMTTDTVAKVASSRAGEATVIGVAKGVGMIEPDMATLIALFCTDADLAPGALDAAFRRVIDRTLNAVSIDTDTSTSDTAAIMASGAAGAVEPTDFERALFEVALSLTRQIARDGEGATTLIEVLVDGARDDAQAKRVGKAVVNSPLVKTAVHGADPNWGRVAMAIGKCADETDIDPDQVVIRFGEREVYPLLPDETELVDLSSYLAGDEVLIHVSLGIAGGSFTVYGCDLTDGYVRINADYTT